MGSQVITTLSTPNFQPQSPLFNTLPGEIRNDIFALALIQHEDDEEAYPEDSYWYRPGFRAPRRSSSALLRTCKRAYAEGQKVFLRDLEWAFWFDRGPAGRSGSAACQSFFNNLTPEAAQRLGKVRFFTQMYWLEGRHNLRALMRLPNFQPHTLTITIRYSDWWFWEDNQPLCMREDCLNNFMGHAGLRELRVEYETLAWKGEEMMKIVQRNKRVKLALRGGEGHLSAEGTQLEEWRWSGTSRLGGQEWRHHGEGSTVEYVVVVDKWVFVEGAFEGRNEVEEEEEGVEWYGDEWEEEEEEEDDEDDEMEDESDDDDESDEDYVDADEDDEGMYEE